MPEGDAELAGEEETFYAPDERFCRRATRIRRDFSGGKPELRSFAISSAVLSNKNAFATGPDGEKADCSGDGACSVESASRAELGWATAACAAERDGDESDLGGSLPRRSRRIG